jgi:hypothetical protein
MTPFHPRQKKNKSAPSALDDTRFPRSYRFVGLVLFTLIGIWLLSSGIATGTQIRSTTSNAVSASSTSESIKDSQAGAVNTSVHKTNTLIPNICLPTDVNCMHYSNTYLRLWLSNQ